MSRTLQSQQRGRVLRADGQGQFKAVGGGITVIVGKRPCARLDGGCIALRFAFGQGLQALLPAGAARNAVDLAFWDLECKQSGKRAWELAGLGAQVDRAILLGIGLSALIRLLVGLLTGSIPLMHANISPLVTIVSLVPPMAILPILFIVFGLGELSKVMLIVIGVAPIIARDMQRQTREIPFEQLVKAQTLGANSLQILTGVLLPQLVPRLIGAVRLALGTGWLFLIAAEAIASTDGLGYRIFLVRRYLAMDVILPYVAWITLLAFSIDWLLVRLNRRFFPWYHSMETAR